MQFLLFFCTYCGVRITLGWAPSTYLAAVHVRRVQAMPAWLTLMHNERTKIRAKADNKCIIFT